MSNTAAPSANAAPEGAATALKPFVVRFQDWTPYRLTVMASSETQAIEIAQAKSTGDLWEADIIDGGQEHWEAFPAPAAQEGGAS